MIMAPVAMMGHVYAMITTMELTAQVKILLLIVLTNAILHNTFKI